ncbi:MAG: bifunctional (p)ppGpp synthetase/guanosine-3',5'-bis(diphosphate) 3'-pyrophosphohydrolase [Alphaproteobacteria bacterium]|nr:bifunctional (p)ppGpp synthetase/guanosine-3',5'-bis(diphosphate) 3'-pyrophosphohydrolase [Alphaproteobacteria bacterium]
MMRQYELVERVKEYDPAADEQTLNRAYVFSMKAHGNQQRASGDSYFSHPVEVAGILTEKKLDAASIITGLLHDTVEDTVATLDDIEGQFGGEIARLVDGVTKLSQLELQSDRSKQAENFRKLVLAMSQDIRVLIVKLADRLHNMRTLGFIKDPDKRRRIARETMDIYIPLAERIGIRDWKEELEDLAFAELNPDARASILSRLDFLRQRGGDVGGRVMDELRAKLSEQNLQADVSGREKLPNSIWRKMQRKNVGFEQLSDIMAFRILVESVEDCYRALGIIHSNYRLVPGRFKDHISLPKPNGYRSLHTTVLGPENQRVEIQIRTWEMHEVAELGVAAHWQYKQGMPPDRRTEGMQYRWLRELLEILDHAGGAEEFLEHTRMEMFADQVFCFTPKGELHALPNGATPVDLAYAVHTDIGNTCVGAKINGRMTPLRTELNNGDQVEIITSKAQTPSPTWESFVVTGKARACIRRFVRGQERQEYMGLGREIVEKVFGQDGYELTDKAIDGVLDVFHCRDADELFTALGAGNVAGGEVLAAVYPGSKKRSWRQVVVPLRRARKGKTEPVAIKGLTHGMAVHMAGCCHPLPGDRIVGVQTTGKGVTIHTIDCEVLESFSDMPERWIDVAWDADSDSAIHTARINVVISNAPGSLGVLSTVVGRDGGNISNLKITDRSSDFFEMLIDIEVEDLKQLTNIVAALRATSVINSVKRARD